MEIGSVSLSQSLQSQIGAPATAVNQQIAVSVLKDQMQEQADMVSTILSSSMTYNNQGQAIPSSASSIDVRM